DTRTKQPALYHTTDLTNHKPRVKNGGPYAIREGQRVMLDAAGTRDADHDVLTYAWDVNGDGTFTDASGPRAALSWKQLRRLRVRGTDSDGDVTRAPALAVELVATPPKRKGLAMLGDLVAGPGSSDPANFVKLNGFVLFTASDGGKVRRLWRSDGTAAGSAPI